MREPRFGAETRIRRRDREEQFLDAEGAFDQRFDFAVARKLDGTKRCRARVVLGINDGEPRNVEPRLAGKIPNSRLRPHERRRQISRKFTGQRELQRVAVAGVDDGGRERRLLSRPEHKLLKMRVMIHRLEVGKAPRGCQRYADGRAKPRAVRLWPPRALYREIPRPETARLIRVPSRVRVPVRCGASIDRTGTRRRR